MILILFIVAFILFKKGLVVSRLFVDGRYFSVVGINVLDFFVVDFIHLVLRFLNLVYRTVDLVPRSFEVVLRVGKFLGTRVVRVRSSASVLPLPQVFLFLTLLLTSYLLNGLKVSTTIIGLFDGHVSESFSFYLS